MFIGYIVGFAFLPVSVIVFLNVFGITAIANLLGIDILLIAAIGIILVELGDIIDSHLKSENVFLT